jgi:hypothetical protein
MIKLYLIQINGTPILDLPSYNINELNNKPLTIITSGSVSDTQYIDKTNNALEIIHRIGDTMFENYQTKQRMIKLFGYQKGWDNCSDDEKDIIINYYANPQPPNISGNTRSTQVITHLMTKKGLSYDESLDKLIDTWHEHWSKYLEDTPLTWRNTVKIVVKHLSLNDSADLFDKVEAEVNGYLSTGRLGITFGDSKPGLLNYIRSSYNYENSGLISEGYVLNKGTYPEFIELLTQSLAGKYWDLILNYEQQ